MAEQVLRQALNKVDVWGYALESTLAVKTFNDKVSGLPYTAISGDVTLKINDEETQVVSYISKELTKDGAVSKNFKALQTAISEMVTVTDIAQGLSVGEASMLTCQGELTLNEYKGQDGNVIKFTKITGKFAPSRFKGEAKEFEPKAKFDIQGIVAKNTSVEIDKEDNETGRLKISILVPLYKGKVIPLDFVTSETLSQNNKDYLVDNFVKNASINIYGNLVNKSKEIERVVEAGFGEDKIEKTYDRTREFVAIGGSLYEDGVHKEVFDVSLLSEALANRERFLSTLTVKENTVEKNTGFGSAPTTAVNTAPQKSGDDVLGDLNLFGDD